MPMTSLSFEGGYHLTDGETAAQGGLLSQGWTVTR